MKKLLLSSCLLIALSCALSVHAVEYKYIFVPSSTSDGTPLNEWGGALFLDAPMSAGGSLADIDQSDSVLKTPYGSYTLASSSDVAIGTEIVGNSRVPVPFTWNASTITSMDVTGFGPLTDKEGSVYQWQITQTTVEIGLNDPTANGVWIASVPDAFSTAMLGGLAVAGLWAFGCFAQTRPSVSVRR